MSQEDRPVVTASGTTKGSLGLLVIGAGLIVGGWVVFSVIAGEWNTGAVYVALALLVLLSAFGIGGISIGLQTQRLIGWFFGLVVVAEVLTDLRYERFPDEAMDWMAYIVFTAGAVVMFVGARQLSD